MMKCLRRVSVVLVTMLTAASVCLAADPGGSPGQGSLGGGFGRSSFLADGDYVKSRDGGGTERDVWGTRSASGRFAFAGSFRYVASKHWRWQLASGFVWTGYDRLAPIPFRTNIAPNDSTMGEVLTLMMPISFQIQMLQRTKSWLFHLGAGPGVYRVWLEQNRKVIEDPATHVLHTGFYPGGSAEIGAEYFLKSQPAVSLEFAGGTHVALATRDEQFPSGFNSSIVTIEARFGANYYFTPGAKKSAASVPKR